MKLKIGFWLRFFSSFGLIIWLLYSIDFKQMWKPLDPHSSYYLVLLFLLLNFDRFLMAYKWRILLQAKKIELPFKDILRGYYFGTFWGIFLPATVGGDAVRALRVAKQVESHKDLFSSVVMERVLGSLAALLIAFICLILADEFLDLFDWQTVVAMAVIVAVFAAGIYFSFHGRIHTWLASKSLFERKGFWGKLSRLYQSYLEYSGHRGAMLRFLGWSLIEQCVPIFGVYLTAAALDRDISLWYCAILVPLIMTLTKIPISLDGYGIREGLYVYLFSLIGISEADAFTIGLFSHIMANIALLPGFIYSSFF